MDDPATDRIEELRRLDPERAAARDRDRELVDRIRGGDGDAFGQLYDAWFDRVFDLVSRIVRDQEVAAEVAQDAFLSAWRKLDTLDNPDAFGGWLLRIARNAAYNRSEKEQRSRPVDGQELAVIESVGAGASNAPSGFAVEDRLGRAATPGVAVEDREIVDLVWQAAAALPARDLEVLDLQLRHGLGPAEIGEILGMNRNAANQLVHRVRGRLEVAIRARVLWRAGEPVCEVLAQRLSQAGVTTFDAEAVRVIERHVPGCNECDERQRLRLEPAALFGALPLLVAPLLVKAQACAGLAAAGVPMTGSAFAASSLGAATGGALAGAGSGSGAGSGGGLGSAAGNAGQGVHAAGSLGSATGGAVPPHAPAPIVLSPPAPIVLASPEPSVLADQAAAAPPTPPPAAAMARRSAVVPLAVAASVLFLLLLFLTGVWWGGRDTSSSSLTAAGSTAPSTAAPTSAPSTLPPATTDPSTTGAPATTASTGAPTTTAPVTTTTTAPRTTTTTAPTTTTTRPTFAIAFTLAPSTMTTGSWSPVGAANTAVPTLTWDVAPRDKGTIKVSGPDDLQPDVVLSTAASGSVMVCPGARLKGSCARTPDGTYTYTLTVTGPDGTVWETRTQTLTVKTPVIP